MPDINETLKEKNEIFRVDMIRCVDILTILSQLPRPQRDRDLSFQL
jgi:hypothetical protein